MCTTSLCNDNDYNALRERPNNFLRKQLGPQRLPFDSVAQGEIENNFTKYSIITGVNASTPGQSSKHISATSIIFLHPDTLSSPKQNISLTSPKILPLSIINITTSQQNKTNFSTDTLYVDNSVTDLDTTHAMPTHHELPVTPRDEAINDDIDGEEETTFDDIWSEEDTEGDTEEDDIEPNSLVPKRRVPRQTQGETSYIRN